jgi:N-acetylmuramoyl-L-alanine amidase
MLSKKFGDAKVQKQDLLLLKKSASPTIVAELGYLSNQEDLEYLTSEMGQTEIAKQILEFIKEN